MTLSLNRLVAVETITRNFPGTIVLSFKNRQKFAAPPYSQSRSNERSHRLGPVLSGEKPSLDAAGSPSHTEHVFADLK